MKPMQFTIRIQASRAKVWETLWQDDSFRSWAGLIDPGTYMVGNLKQGEEVQFISAENGYGVTSLVEKLDAGEYLLLRHSEDTKEAGEQQREEEWTGGEESYLLEEKDGVTTLNVAFDVPLELKEYFEENYPKALQRIKELAEQSSK